MAFGDDPAIGFNRRKMDAERKALAEAETGAKRVADAQVVAPMRNL